MTSDTTAPENPTPAATTDAASTTTVIPTTSAPTVTAPTLAAQPTSAATPAMPTGSWAGGYGQQAADTRQPAAGGYGQQPVDPRQPTFAAPPQQPTGPNPGASGAAYLPVQPRTNVLGILTLVFGILGFGIVPVVTGHIALGQIKRTGEEGRGLTLAGLILGYVTVAGWLLVALFWIGAFGIAIFSHSVAR